MGAKTAYAGLGFHALTSPVAAIVLRNALAPPYTRAKPSISPHGAGEIMAVPRGLGIEGLPQIARACGA